jgi:hypothetical protein
MWGKVTEQSRTKRCFLARALVLLGALLGVMHAATPQTVLPVEQAPYHVPVFNNEHVRVLNVFIPAQRTSGFHRHSTDSLGVLIGEGPRTVEGLSGAVTSPPARAAGAVTFSFYSREPIVHAVTVTGDTPFRNIVVELLKSGPEGFTPGSRDNIAGYTLVLDNDRVRAWRLVLAPGEEAPAVTQTAPGIRIVVAGNELVERVPGRADRGIAPHPGEFFWQDVGITRAVRNVGTTRLELVEVELK